MTSLASLLAESPQQADYATVAAKAQQIKDSNKAKKGLERFARDLYDTLDENSKVSYKASLVRCNIAVVPPTFFSKIFASISTKLGNLGQRIFTKLSSKLNFSFLFGKLDPKTAHVRYIDQHLTPTIKKIKTILNEDYIGKITTLSPVESSLERELINARYELLPILESDIKNTFEDEASIKKGYSAIHNACNKAVAAFNKMILEALVGLENEKSDTSNPQAQELGNSHLKGFLGLISSERISENLPSTLVESDDEFSSALSSMKSDDSASQKSHSASESGAEA